MAIDQGWPAPLQQQQQQQVATARGQVSALPHLQWAGQVVMRPVPTWPLAQCLGLLLVLLQGRAPSAKGMGAAGGAGAAAAE
jgi:hypothetical protein